AFRTTWRVSADNCLVFGAGVLGGRKYFLPTGSAHYRIHGNNSWWGKRSPSNDYLNLFHSRCLVHHYAQRIGLDPGCVELLRHEFKTKPVPSWQETKRYARLVMRRRGSWFKNLDRAFSILRKGWKLRDQAAQEIRHKAR
ncbi:MAG TPA: glycosyltransferase family 2 protein, partial [Lysobacter sp.]|nr:glycosyltransferase family 2 protein [Lysobacter sp.]